VGTAYPGVAWSRGQDDGTPRRRRRARGCAVAGQSQLDLAGASKHAAAPYETRSPQHRHHRAAWPPGDATPRPRRGAPPTLLNKLGVPPSRRRSQFGGRRQVGQRAGPCAPSHRGGRVAPGVDSSSGRGNCAARPELGARRGGSWLDRRARARPVRLSRGRRGAYIVRRGPQRLLLLRPPSAYRLYRCWTPTPRLGWMPFYRRGTTRRRRVPSPDARARRGGAVLPRPRPLSTPRRCGGCGQDAVSSGRVRAPR
jgi:hypothetical protein